MLSGSSPRQDRHCLGIVTSSHDAVKATPPPRAFPFLIAGLSTAGPLAVDTYLPALPEIASSLGVSELAVQQSLTAYMIPFGLMSLWHGAISDVFGRRQVVLWGLALFAILSGVCALARSLPMLLLFRALQGIVAGAGLVVGRAIVRDMLSGAAAQRMMSHVMMAFAVAPAVAPIIGGWLDHWFGWQSIFLFLVVYAVVMWVVCLRLLPESLPPERRMPFSMSFLARSYFTVLTSGRFLSLCAAFTLNFAGMFIYIMSAPVFLMKHLHVGGTDFFWLFGPTTGGMLLGAWASGRMALHLTGRQTVWCGYAIMAVGAAGNVLLNLFVPAGLPWSVVPIPVYTFGMSMVFPSLALMSLDLFPAQRGLAASCQSFVQTVAAALTASVIAPLLWGSTLHLAVGGALLMLAGLAMFVLFNALTDGASTRMNGGHPAPAPEVRPAR